MKKILKSVLLLTTVWAFAGLSATAQPGSGGPGPGTPAGPTDVPIDGGVSLLLAGGVGYALRRLRQRRQQ
ncbi:PID-CTERM protein-sorting domain-containing protein [Hymenobacter antarcticus]